MSKSSKPKAKNRNSVKHTPAPATAPARGSRTTMYLVVAGLVAVAFFGAFEFARSQSAPASPASQPAVAAAVQSPVPPAAGSSTQPSAAKVAGGVQKISVDTSNGYNPSVISLKAGVPAEITFGQSNSCAAFVQSQDLGFQVDASSGPRTVKLGVLKPGTYDFACGMDMYRGQIVVQG